MCVLHTYSPASPWTQNPDCPHFIGLGVHCYTISSGVPGEEPTARQVLYLCVLSGSLADPIFHSYSAQSKQSSPRVSVRQHCRTCAILFSHCTPGPPHRMPPQKHRGHIGSQNTQDQALVVGGLHQKAGCNRRRKDLPQEEVTSTCHLTDHETLGLSIKAEVAKQLRDVSWPAAPKWKWHQTNSMCLLAPSMCFMGLM